MFETDYYIKLIVRDIYSNQSFDIISINIDNTLPNVSIFTPGNMQLMAGTVNITGTVQDDNLASYLLEYKKQADTEYQFIYFGHLNVSNQVLGSLNIEDGVYDLRIKAVDKVSNIKNESVSFIVDNTIPVIQELFAFPSPFTPGRGTSISIIVSENCRADINIYSTNGPLIKTIGSNIFLNTGMNSMQWSGDKDIGGLVPYDEYVIKVNAKDLAGNIGDEKTGPVISGYDMYAPDISDLSLNPSVISPLGNSIYSNTTIQYVLSDNFGGDVKNTLIIYDDQNIPVITLLTDQYMSQGTNSMIWPGTNSSGQYVVDGVYKIVITAEDVENNESIPAVGFVTIDNIIPEISNLTINTDKFSPDGDGVAEQLDITYDLNKAGDIYVDIINTNNLRIGTYIFKSNTASGNVTYNWDGKDRYEGAVSSGYYYFVISALDYLINYTMKTSEVFLLDKDAPQTVLSISEPKLGSNDYYLNNYSTFTLKADDEFLEIKMIKYRFNSDAWVNITSNEVIIPLSSIGEGSNVLEYYAIDNLDNIEETNIFHFYNDNTPPAIQFITRYFDYNLIFFEHDNTLSTQLFYKDSTLYVGLYSDLMLKGNDYDGVGVANIKYIPNNSTWISTTNYPLRRIKVTNRCYFTNEYGDLYGDGSYNMEWTGIDCLSNQSTTNYTNFVIDATPPV